MSRRDESLPDWGDPIPRDNTLGDVAFIIGFVLVFMLLLHVAMDGGV